MNDDDDFGDVLDALDDPPQERGVVPFTAVDALIARLGADLTEALADAQGFQLARATPAQREALVRFRDTLLAIKAPLVTWLDRIDAMWLELARRTGATEFNVSDTTRVFIEPAPPTYVVEAHEMRGALLALVRDGILTTAEVDAAVRPETAYKLDNGKLNTLARRKGDKVRETIERHRARVEKHPLEGKVRYTRGPRP